MIKIILGHPAYRNENAHHVCFTKEQAVRVLRGRGMTRKKARDELTRIMSQTRNYDDCNYGIINIRPVAMVEVKVDYNATVSEYNPNEREYWTGKLDKLVALQKSVGQLSPLQTVRHMYVKRCKSCQNVYWQKDISEQQFNILEENRNIEVSLVSDVWTAEISSCCDECAEEVYSKD